MLNLSYSDNKNIIVQKKCNKNFSIIRKMKEEGTPKRNDDASDAYIGNREKGS